MISVVIPVKDGGEELRRCLDAIARQRVDEEVELVVVDSGSTDGSPELARAHGAHVQRLEASGFSHGGARNRGAEAARGEVLVFTSQDASAIDDRWLATLVAALRRDPEIAGAYGRQLAHDDARPPERYFLDFLYGPRSRTQRAASRAELSLHTTLFSNVNSALPRSVWEEFRFAEDVIMSEDQELSARMLLAGRAIAYEPQAAVRHSHRYTIPAAFRRFFDSGVSGERAYLAGAAPSARALRGAAWHYARGELSWLWHTGQARWVPYAILYEAAKWLGLQAGTRHRHLPLWLKRRLSALPAYWSRADGARPPLAGEP